MAWWNLLLSPVTGLFQAGAKLGSQWMEGKQKEHQMKMAYKERVITGQIDYNVAAQKGMAASIKDEFLTVWITTLVSLHFVPSMQPYLEKGWDALKMSAPDWFGYCFVGMWVAVFGLKGWKIFKE
jgi:hypothetical protein